MKVTLCSKKSMILALMCAFSSPLFASDVACRPACAPRRVYHKPCKLMYPLSAGTEVIEYSKDGEYYTESTPGIGPGIAQVAGQVALDAVLTATDVAASAVQK